MNQTSLPPLPASWSELSWQQITDVWRCKMRYGGNGDVAIVAAILALYGTLVSEFIGKCLMTFRPKLWNEKEREIYDNNNDVVCGIYCIVGYLCALLFMPSLKVAMFVWGVCCGIDNIGWLVVYHKNRDRFREIEVANDSRPI